MASGLEFSVWPGQNHRFGPGVRVGITLEESRVGIVMGFGPPHPAGAEAGHPTLSRLMCPVTNQLAYWGAPSVQKEGRAPGACELSVRPRARRLSLCMEEPSASPGGEIPPAWLAAGPRLLTMNEG